MGCNCGDNEYNITVNNNGNYEPTTPIYNITLANVGVNGYSPIVRFVNETVEGFNIAVDNVTGTETSPAVPKLSYVADQINNVNTTIANLGNTYLTRDGSNAANPININGLTIREQYGNLYISTNAQVSFSSNANPISIGGRSIDLISTNVGSVRLLPNYGVILNAAENKNISLTTSGTGIATYNNKEIATVNQLPTVGNGTITITQGGITKGTFTTNQSGNSTIEIDKSGETYLAGEGISIRDNYIWLDYNLNRGLDVPEFSNSLAIKTDGDTISFDSDGALTIAPSLLAQYVTNTSLATTLANYALSADIPTVGNGTITINQSGTQKGTFTLNQSGDVTIDLDVGGESYTAGTGIDITNDTISVDSTVLTTNTAQTVTGDKTFSADIHLDGGDIRLDSTTSRIYGKDTNDNYKSIIARSVGSSEIYIGNQGDVLKLAGRLPHLKYNNADVALLADVPTVNNSTITFTQGGVTKGTITLNQSSNQTIALDAGGSGGGAVDSVNGQTGTVVLTASDVGALPSTTVIPTKTSDLTNDSGFITNSALSGYATETWVGQQGFITSADLPTNYVTTDTAQTITGVKTFSGSIKTNTVYNTTNNPMLQIYNSTIRVGNSNYGLKLLGDSTRPEYSMDGGRNYNQLALLSDIPTITLREWS